MEKIKPKSCLRRVLLMVLMLGTTIGLFAQQKTITGVINDENGLPLPQATIIIKGTTKGVLTDFDGKFSMEVAPTDVLIVSYVGYSPKEVKVGTQSAITVKLGIVEMDAVVKIGYGTQKKADLTSAVSVVSSEELNKVPVASFDKALQGKASGVMVTSNSGKPGSGATIRIRGIGSINEGTNPLIVVDGVPFDGGINSINPADIESFQVLKDASATAIYGARGANGVIIITTKRGAAGLTKVNFSTYHSLNVMPKYRKMLSADQYLTLLDSINPGEFANIPGIPEYSYRKDTWRSRGSVDTDWQKAITQLAPQHNYALSVSGGNEYSNFSISGSYYNEEGVLKSTDFERYMIRANSDFYIGEKKKIKIGESINLSRINIINNTIGGWTEAWQASPIMPIYDANNLGGYAGSSDSLTGENDKTNPLGELLLKDSYNDATKVFVSVYAEVELLKGLKYKVDISGIYDFGSSTSWSPRYDLGKRTNLARSLGYGQSASSYYKVDNFLTYTLPKDSGDAHNLTILAGTSAERSYFRDVSISVLAGFEDYAGWEAPVPVLGTADDVNIGGGYSENAMTGLVGRILYDYNSKYLFTASIRQDGSSRFGPNKRIGYFPSFSAGWKINEDLFNDVESIDLMKLRAGWGQTGNANIRNYAFLEVMDAPINSQYVFGTTQQTVYGAQSYASTGNPDLKWEAAEMTNIGFDLNLFKNMIQLSGEYYYKSQEDMLVLVELPYASGKQRSYARPYVNLGKVANQGYEFNLIHKNKKGDFDYSVSANLTTVKNEVIDIPETIYSGLTITKVGNSIGSFYGHIYEGLFQNQAEIDAHASQPGAQPGDFKFKDLNGDNKIDANDRTIIGKPTPDLVYGFNFDLNYKGFDFSMFFNGIVGSEIYHSAKTYSMPYLGNAENRFVEVLNYWTPSNPNADIPRLSLTDANNNMRASSYFIESGNFIRLRSVQLGYTLPKSITTNLISRARIYIGGANLLTLTGYSGYDPEISSGDALNANIDEGSYPVPRTYTIGAQIDF